MAPPYSFSVIPTKLLEIFFWNSLTFPHFVWGLRSRCQKFFVAAAAAAAAALFSDIRLEKAANWIIWEVIHLLSPNLVHRGRLTFWIDSKGFLFHNIIKLPQNAAK